MTVHSFPQNPVFENCSCVATRLLDMPSYVNSTYSEVLGTNSTATDGLCDQGCNQLGLFLFFTALSLFLVFMLYTPNVIITIRYDCLYMSFCTHIARACDDVMFCCRGRRKTGYAIYIEHTKDSAFTTARIGRLLSPY